MHETWTEKVRRGIITILCELNRDRNEPQHLFDMYMDTLTRLYREPDEWVGPGRNTPVMEWTCSWTYMVVDVDGSIEWSCIMVTTGVRNNVSSKLRHVAPVHLDVFSSTCCTIRDRLCCAHSHSSSGLRSLFVLFCEFPLHIRMMVISWNYQQFRSTLPEFELRV